MAARTGVIDRIEGPTAVIIPNHGVPFTIPKSQLPPGAKEGSRVRVENGEVRLLPPDFKQQTIIRSLMQKLFK